MSGLRRSLTYAGVALLALALGAGISHWLRQPGQASPGMAASLLANPMVDLQGKPHLLSQYRGKVLVVNFWATWCPPCREEIPLFVEKQADLSAKGVQFVGIALDEKISVEAFALEKDMNYPVLIGSMKESETMRELGNPGGLPYTLIFDREGHLREKIIGGLNKARLQQILQPYL